MKTENITLDSPIKRGETTINTVEIRLPKAGELRGVSLVDLIQLDVDALQVVLPRLTTNPNLTKPEVVQLAPSDLMKFGIVVAGFLVPKETSGPDSE